MIGLITRVLVKMFVRKKVDDYVKAKAEAAFSFVGSWRVLKVDFEGGRPSWLDDHLKHHKPANTDSEAYFKSLIPNMKVDIHANGKYLVDVQWVIIEGTWQQNSPTCLTLVDQDNGTKFFVEAQNISNSATTFRFSSGDVDKVLLSVQKKSG